MRYLKKCKGFAQITGSMVRVTVVEVEVKVKVEVKVQAYVTHLIRQLCENLVDCA